MFDIHEDTLGEELDNLVQHSTRRLEISDEYISPEFDEHEKENIPPSALAPTSLNQSEMTALVVPEPVSRQSMMHDGERMPLGDLDVYEIYAKGCDSESWMVIPEEREGSNNPKYLNSHCNNKGGLQSPVDAAGENQDVWRELLAQVNAQNAAPNKHRPANSDHETDEATNSNGAELLIEI